MKKYAVIFVLILVALTACQNAVNESPSISILQPNDGDVIFPGDNVVITVDVSDPEGEIAKVKYYIDGALVRTVETSPYSLTWQTLMADPGSHLIKAEVFDVEEDSTADSITIDIDVPEGMVFVTSNTSDDHTFDMGCNSETTGEQPVHPVELTDYCIAKYPVTVSEFIEFLNDAGVSEDGTYMGVKVFNFGGVLEPNYPYKYSGSFYFSPFDRVKSLDCPASYVTWYGAVHYCNWLSQQDGFETAYTINDTIVTQNLYKKGYRLPTEAEWEFAARGGENSNGYTYSGSNTIDDVAWYSTNAWDVGREHADFGTHPVGTKAANELGIYDMSGNEWEWCWDYLGDYGSDKESNPTGPTSGTYRAARGGCYWGPAEWCTNTIRGGGKASGTGKSLRLVIGTMHTTDH